METRVVIVIFLTVLAVWLLLPIEIDLPHYNSAEELVQTCNIPGSSTVIRFYLGNAGATTAFWYVLTVDRDWTVEKLFFQSYSEPVVKAIACNQQGVTIQYESNPEQFFPSREIFEKLTKQPVLIYRGDLIIEDEKPVIKTSQYLGTVLLLSALLILYRGKRKAHTMISEESERTM